MLPAARLQQNQTIRTKVWRFLPVSAARAFYDELPAMRLSAQAMQVITFLEQLITGYTPLSVAEVGVLHGVHLAPASSHCAPWDIADRLLRLGLVTRTTRVGSRFRLAVTERGKLELNIRNL